MTLITETRLLFRRKLLELVREPVWVFMGLSTPLLYLALFAPLLKPLEGGPGFASGNVLDVFVPGVLVLMAFSAGMGAGWIAIGELDGGVVERMSVTPVSRFALVMGTVLRDVVAFIVPAVLVVLVAVPFGYEPHWEGTAVLLALLSLVAAITSAWSGALGIRLGRIGSLAAVVTGLQLPLTLLSGMLLPLALGPEWIRVLAHLNPLYYAVEAARVLSAGTIASATVGEAFAVLGALAVVTIWWSTRTYEHALA